MNSNMICSRIRNVLLVVSLLGWLLFAALAWFSRGRIIDKINAFVGTTSTAEPWKPRIHQVSRELAEQPWLDPRKPVVMIGDSQLELCQWYPLFRGALPIRNLGVSMSRIADAELVSASLEPSRASAVVILTGINDLTSGRSENQMLRDYRKLLDTVKSRAPGIPVLVLSMMPVGTDLGGMNESEINRRVSVFNRLLRAEAESRGIRFLDLIDYVGDQGRLNPALTLDGLHLNEAGYRAIAPGIYEALTTATE